MKHKRYEGEPEEIRTDYFHWLCEYVGTTHNECSYFWLLNQLHRYEFSEDTAYLIPNDNNRISDGKNLRREFSENTLYLDECYAYIDKACSVLELLIGVAKRLEEDLNWDTSHDDTPSYFWELIENLQLDSFDDDLICEGDEEFVDEIVGTFLNRRYRKDGRGGLFPLRDPKEDQRYVEIWYQMSNYMAENYPI